MRGVEESLNGGDEVGKGGELAAGRVHCVFEVVILTKKNMTEVVVDYEREWVDVLLLRVRHSKWLVHLPRTLTPRIPISPFLTVQTHPAPRSQRVCSLSPPHLPFDHQR